MIRHLDLFSGIGGFALATEMAFPEEKIEHIFCDNDLFAQEILKKHWLNATIYGDIRQLKGEGLGKIDLLTGGFPCQPFSAAGRRRGTEDDRHLWPEMLRVIRETNPAFVLGENVGGLLTWDGGMVFEQVCTDLESEGYEVGTFVIPAAALNAPHRRDTVWIAAHAVGSNARRASRQFQGSQSEERIQERDDVGQSGKSSEIYASDTRREHGSARRNEEVGASASERFTREPDFERRSANDTDTSGEGLERGKREESERYGGLTDRDGRNERWDWNQDWYEVATRFCRVDDGIPRRMDRTPRLKALGNAIVPQVAMQIIKNFAL